MTRQRITKAAGVIIKVAGLTVIILFFFGLWTMPGSHTYHRQALLYLDTARQVLIAHGVCQNANHCVTREFSSATAAPSRSVLSSTVV
jgi:hypothetical protein